MTTASEALIADMNFAAHFCFMSVVQFVYDDFSAYDVNAVAEYIWLYTLEKYLFA